MSDEPIRKFSGRIRPFTEPNNDPNRAGQMGACIPTAYDDEFYERDVEVKSDDPRVVALAIFAQVLDERLESYDVGTTAKKEAAWDDLSEFLKVVCGALEAGNVQVFPDQFRSSGLVPPLPMRTIRA